VTAVTDFSRIFTSDAFCSEPVLVVAVSGGSDSTALLFRTKAHLSSATRLVAVTVDHALRPESAMEAAAVGALCARHGIEHRIMRWPGDKPAAGIQAAARLARYALLAQAAVDLGGRLVLTGHTADDQAETIAMRMERGEGPGLAGIAPVTLYEREVWFARPQLGERRAALRAELRQRGVGWFDDPSNDNIAFERVRVRRDLVAMGGDAFDRLIERGAAATAERIDLGRQAAVMIGRYATPRQAGADIDAIGLEPSFLLEMTSAATHALRILLATVGAAEQLPDLERTDALLQRLRETDRGRFSLARAVIAKRRNEILLTRERRGKASAAIGETPAMQSPWQHLLPCFDLEPARAVDKLLGRSPSSALPWP